VVGRLAPPGIAATWAGDDYDVTSLVWFAKNLAQHYAMQQPQMLQNCLKYAHSEFSAPAGTVDSRRRVNSRHREA
jgi:hypothetical protein